jgi:hypothetical protein
LVSLTNILTWMFQTLKGEWFVDCLFQEKRFIIRNSFDIKKSQSASLWRNVNIYAFLHIRHSGLITLVLCFLDGPYLITSN